MLRKPILALTLLSVAGAPAAAADPESEFRGRRLAEANCAECHAISMLDRSENPKAPPFRSLPGARSLADLRADMAGDLFRRHPEMPDFEPAPQQLNDIVNFIGSIGR